MKKNTAWDHVADWYDVHLEKTAGTYQRDLILPNLLRLVQPKKGSTIVDLACGQGFFARQFAAEGARVIGADLSRALITRARSRATVRVEWHVAPAHHLSFLKPESVDAITIVLALQNIENIHAVFDESARILAPQGSLWIVINHPAFRIPSRSHWGWDETTRTQFRRVDAYMTEAKIPIIMHPGKRPEETTTSFHRPLQTYAKILSNSGFAIARLEEWVSKKTSERGPRAQAENRARAEFPLFLMIEAKKVHAGSER